MKRSFALLLIASLVLISCGLDKDRVKGNGTIKTETRTASSFNSVDVNGNIQVFIKQDSVYSVRVEADENLLSYIIIKTDGDKLVIEPKDHSNLSGTKEIKVYVSAPQFRKLDVSGASGITSENLLSAENMDIGISGASSAKLEIKTPGVSADVTGASSLYLKGQTKDMEIDATGASQVRCFELLSENADVNVSGASNADVFASVSLKADASGASHIKYKGAAQHTGNASGAGSISKVD